ncbi:hypothetical protein B0H13DRAFT_1881496 [Mycena leptocephala]|nr:hypothetical protein B0H13DRAFT_1881496 [Mycena leptocephala]
MVTPGMFAASNSLNPPTESSFDSDWLPNSIMIVKLAKDGAEAIPFSFVKGVFSMVLTLLETVQKVKGNQDDLKEVCESALEIVQHVDKMIKLHGDAIAGTFKDLCTKFMSFLQELQQSVEKLNNQQSGVSGFFKRVLKADSTAAKILAYREQIKQLQANFTVNIGRRHVSVLYGLGGAGKTQTALKFLEQSSGLGRFSSVFFIDASTLGTLKLSFQGLAVVVHAGDTVWHALQWLVAQRTEWLLLFNNADDTGIDLQQFMPGCSHGNILITTRNPALCVHAPDSHYRLSDMEEADAVELLLRSSLTEYSPEKKQIAREIVQVLHYFPLAIIQAGAYISKTSHRARLLKEKPAQTQDGYAFTVYTTWEISFNRLSKPAVQLLQLCSFLHHEGITETIFSRAIPYKGTELGELGPTTEDLRDAREFLAQFVAPSGTWDSLTFAEVIAEIQGYSLIELDGQKKICSIHPLVHTWTQSMLPDAQSTWHCMVTIIQMSGPAGFGDKSNQRFHVQCLPHIDSLLTEAKRTELTYQLTFGLIYYLGGHPAEAQQLLSTYARKAIQQLGKEHPDTLSAMANLAGSYKALGQLNKAAELEAMVLEKRKLLLGEEHPDTLSAMANLAVSYRKLGQLKEAAELEAVVFEKRKLLLGEEHPDTLSAMANLAGSYKALGQLKEAAELKAIVFEKRKLLLGEDHPDTLSAMANLAGSYKALGQLKEAAELEAVVFEKRKLLLGEEHPDTLSAMANLAGSYKALGQLKEAAELEAIVLEKRKLLLGEEHPDTLRAMANLAVSCGELGQLKEAAELEALVLEKRKLLLGEDHPDTLTAMGNLAVSYEILGRSKEAAELNTVVSEKRKLHLGEEHPDTLWAMGNLAVSYRKLGQSKEAAELEAVVLEKRKLLLGEDHPDTLIAMGNLAESYEKLGQSKKAAELIAVVLEKRKLLLGKVHPDTLTQGPSSVAYF